MKAYSTGSLLWQHDEMQGGTIGGDAFSYCSCRPFVYAGVSEESSSELPHGSPQTQLNRPNCPLLLCMTQDHPAANLLSVKLSVISPSRFHLVCNYPIHEQLVGNVCDAEPVICYSDSWLSVLTVAQLKPYFVKQTDYGSCHNTVVEHKVGRQGGNFHSEEDHAGWEELGKAFHDRSQSLRVRAG